MRPKDATMHILFYIWRVCFSINLIFNLYVLYKRKFSADCFTRSFHSCPLHIVHYSCPLHNLFLHNCPSNPASSSSNTFKTSPWNHCPFKLHSVHIWLLHTCPSHTCIFHTCLIHNWPLLICLSIPAHSISALSIPTQSKSACSIPCYFI